MFQAAQQGHAGDLVALISDGASVDAESNVREKRCSHCHELVSFGLQIIIQYWCVSLLLIAFVVILMIITEHVVVASFLGH